MAKSVVDIIPSGLDPDIVPVALMELDQRRHVRTLNTVAENLFGLSREAMHGRALTEVLYHDCALFDLLDRSEDTDGPVSSGALKLQGPSLPARRQHVSVNHLSKGGFALALTPSSHAEKTAPGAPGLAAFGRILGHEVKNPLAGISGATQLLLRAAREDQTELMELVLAESRRIERLVNELSAFELFSSPRRLPCNVHEILDRVIKAEQIALGSNIRLSRIFDPSLPNIYGDGDHLHEAFQNIIRNAGQAILGERRGGQIKVFTRFALDRRISQPETGQTGRMLKVVIEDNGPGISQAAQGKIFNMFHTSKPNGSGLGLTVVSQVITAHNGTLDLESQPGCTRFSLYLPIAR